MSASIRLMRRKAWAFGIFWGYGKNCLEPGDWGVRLVPQEDLGSSLMTKPATGGQRLDKVISPAAAQIILMEFFFC
jgi:hypothetical protein